MRRVARNTRDFGQSTSNELRLIIPAFPLTNRMQRNRDNQIDPIEEIGLGKLHRGNACQIVGNIGAMAILEQMDKPLNRSALVEKQKGGCTLHTGYVLEKFHCGIDPNMALLGARQRAHTRFANRRVGMTQQAATLRTAAWEKQIENRMEKSGNRHQQDRNFRCQIK